MAGDEGAVDKGGDGHGGDDGVDELALAGEAADEAEAEVRPRRHDGVVAAARDGVDVFRDELVDGVADVREGAAVSEEWLPEVGVDGSAPQRAVVLSDLDRRVFVEEEADCTDVAGGDSVN
jgi:hypothetical protein